MTMVRLFAGVTLACVLAVGGADAKTFTVRIDSEHDNQTVAFMAGPGDGLVHFANRGTMRALEGNDAPLDGTVGDCFGTGRMAGNQASGSGACSYTDVDGDFFMVVWDIAPNTGGLAGDWHTIGGTGKWAGAVGGGVWSDALAADQKSGTTHIEGVLDLR